MYKYFFNIYFVDVGVGKLASGELEERKVRKTDQSTEIIGITIKKNCLHYNNISTNNYLYH